MVQTCLWQEVVVRVPKAELVHQATGTVIARMVACEQPSHLERPEGVPDHALKGFRCESLAPKFWQQVRTHLEHIFLIWT